MREIGSPRIVKVNKKPASLIHKKNFLILEINERVGFFFILDYSMSRNKFIFRTRHPDGDIIYFTTTPDEAWFEYDGFEYLLTNQRVK